MTEREIILEYYINRLLEDKEHPTSLKQLTPKKKDVFKIDREDSDKPLVSKFFGNLFGTKYNIKNKIVYFVVCKSDSDELDFSTRKCEVLMCNVAKQNYLSFPRLVINKSVPCKDEDDLIQNVYEYGSRIFPYFYDVKFKTCCNNQILINQSNNGFIFILGQKEWSGDAENPHDVVAKDFNKLVWVDVIKLLNDDDYGKTMLFGDESVKILREIAGIIE